MGIGTRARQNQPGTAITWHLSATGKGETVSRPKAVATGLVGDAKLRRASLRYVWKFVDRRTFCLFVNLGVIAADACCLMANDVHRHAIANAG